MNLEERTMQNKSHYVMADENHVCISPGFDPKEEVVYLHTAIDIDQIVQHINNLNSSGELALTAAKSDYVGEYLCGYIYRCSLMKNDKRTLFIHVPSSSSTLTAEDMAKVLNAVIEKIIEIHLQ